MKVEVRLRNLVQFYNGFLFSYPLNKGQIIIAYETIYLFFRQKSSTSGSCGSQ